MLAIIAMVTVVSLQGQPPTLRSVGITNPLLAMSTERFSFPLGRKDTDPVYDIGISPKETTDLVDCVATAVYRSNISPTSNYPSVAKLLADLVDSVLVERKVSENKILRQWLLAEAVGAFCISRIDYATEQTESSFSAKTRSELNEPEVFLAKPRPRAVCSGFTRYAASLSRALGLTCYHIDGFTRNRKIRDWTKPTHGWLLYDFGSGIRVPSDMTSRIHEFDSGRTVTNTDFARLTRKYNWRILPRSVRDWEVFSWMYYQFRLVPGERTPPNLSLTKLSFDSWKNLTYRDEVDKLYLPLYKWYLMGDITLIASVAR